MKQILIDSIIAFLSSGVLDSGDNGSAMVLNIIKKIKLVMIEYYVTS